MGLQRIGYDWATMHTQLVRIPWGVKCLLGSGMLNPCKGRKYSHWHRNLVSCSFRQQGIESRTLLPWSSKKELPFRSRSGESTSKYKWLQVRCSMWSSWWQLSRADRDGGSQHLRLFLPQAEPKCDDTYFRQSPELTSSNALLPLQTQDLHNGVHLILPCLETPFMPWLGWDRIF